MTTVGIRELKNKLSDYIDKVERGARLTVTKRGKVVAIVSPPVEYEAAKDIAVLVREESAAWSGGKPSGNKKAPKIKGKPVAETVLEERR